MNCMLCNDSGVLRARFGDEDRTYPCPECASEPHHTLLVTFAMNGPSGSHSESFFYSKSLVVTDHEFIWCTRERVGTYHLRRRGQRYTVTVFVEDGIALTDEQARKLAVNYAKETW